MSETLVTYELDGPVALIGLNRPDKRNAINEDVIAQLREAVLRACEEADVGVLFGHGENFSSGLDLREALARATGQSAPPRKRRRHSWHEVFDIIARGPIPFVAALRSLARGRALSRIHELEHGALARNGKALAGVRRRQGEAARTARFTARPAQDHGMRRNEP
jgi:enoyl-CoA hydratase/carnithine racemase